MYFEQIQGDKVRQSALGLHPISPPCLMYQKDLMQYSQDVASKFVSAFMEAKDPEATATAEATVTTGSVDATTRPEDVTMGSYLPGKTKATERCQVKSSTKEQSAQVDNSRGEATAPTPVTKAGSAASN